MSHSSAVHSICVFSRGDEWKPVLHKHIADSLSTNYAVIYIAESEVNEVIQRMGRLSADIESHVESGALTVIDRQDFFSASIGPSVLLDQWCKLLNNRKSRRFSGVVAIGMPVESFFENPLHHAKMVEYESTIIERFSGNVRVICCYFSDSLNKMSLGSMIAILGVHGNCLRQDSTTTKLERSELVKIIKWVMSKRLGAETAELVFDTFRLVYRLRDNDLIAQPAKFEEKLVKLLGEHASEIIIQSLKEEYLRAVAF